MCCIIEFHLHTDTHRCLFHVCFKTHTFLNQREETHSYHKRETRHLGHLVTTGDLYSVSWWGEVPIKHRGTVHLSPPKPNPPKNNTQTRHYTLPSQPAFSLIQWSSSTLQECTKTQSTWDCVRSVFIFPPICNEDVCSKRVLLNGTQPQWIWESGKSAFSHFPSNFSVKGVMCWT